MTTGPASRHRQRVTEPAGQPGRISNISQQSGSRMTDHTPAVGGDLHPRTPTSTEFILERTKLVAGGRGCYLVAHRTAVSRG
jgi:hypothetical protein